jgi:hypothetical protein
MPVDEAATGEEGVGRVNTCNNWTIFWLMAPWVISTIIAVALAGWSGANSERMRWLRSLTRTYQIYGNEALPRILDKANDVSGHGWGFVGDSPATKPQPRRSSAPKRQEPPS